MDRRILKCRANRGVPPEGRDFGWITGREERCVYMAERRVKDGPQRVKTDRLREGVRSE